jgi:AcrR family transcriptional regulator
MTTQKRAAQTRSRILAAAAASFAEHGYDATGVEEVCRRAGVSKGAFYHHFPSKQAVFLQLLDQWLETLDDQIASILSEKEDVPAALVTMSSLLQQVFQAASGQLPVFLDFWAKAARDPEEWQATGAPFGHFRDLFGEMIAAGISTGRLNAVDPQVAAATLVAFAAGVLLQGLADPHGADWGQVAEEGVQLFLIGLERN